MIVDAAYVVGGVSSSVQVNVPGMPLNVSRFGFIEIAFALIDYASAFKLHVIPCDSGRLPGVASGWSNCKRIVGRRTSQLGCRIDREFHRSLRSERKSR